MITNSILLLMLVGVFQAATAPPPPQAICDTRKTKNGDCCVFPFKYQGETFYDCTTKNLGMEWCATTDNYDINSNKWGQCEKAPEPIFDIILETNKNESKARSAAGVQLFQGDIVVDSDIRQYLTSRGLVLPGLGSGRTKRAVMRNERSRWIINGKGVVPYFIESSNQHARGVIQRAMDHWMAKVPCLKFVPYRAGLGRYLSFFSGGGCYSMVGRQSTSGAQKISIGRGCEHLGVVVHEIGHALGFWHEQSRPDRDSYVTINWQNIQKGVEFNFHKYDANRINSRGVSYDYDSVMHYSSTAFANRRGVYTIVGKDGRTNLGQRYGLSQKDILQANKLYCGSAPQPATRPPIVTRPPTPPPPGGCQYKDNHRWCPYWKSRGYCTHATHSVYMKRACQKSCNCKNSSSCKDAFADCPGWKSKGYCNSSSPYGPYTRVYCKRSCNTCS